MKRVLVDASAIYALVARRDRNHASARAYLAQSIESGTRFVLADVAFGETMTLLRSRHGAEASIRIGRQLRRSALYVWRPTVRGAERATWDIFQQHDDTAWSYTDCAVFALSHRLGIAEVFAYDTHFDQMPDLLRVPPRTS